MPGWRQYPRLGPDRRQRHSVREFRQRHRNIAPPRGCGAGDHGGREM